MIEPLMVFIAGAAVAGLIIFVAATDVLPFLLQVVVEPAVRWFQRVFLGIDRSRTGDDALIGSIGIAGTFDPNDDGWRGTIVVDGESWRARANAPLQRGSSVEVVARDGLELTVRAR